MNAAKFEVEHGVRGVLAPGVNGDLVTVEHGLEEAGGDRSASEPVASPRSHDWLREIGKEPDAGDESAGKTVLGCHVIAMHAIGGVDGEILGGEGEGHWDKRTWVVWE